MKNKLNKSLTALLLMILIVIAFAAFKTAPQTEGNKYASLSWYPGIVLSSNPEIIITYEDGKTEEIEMPTIQKPKSALEVNIKFTKTINDVCNKGYKIVCVTSLAGGGIITYTLEKL